MCDTVVCTKHEVLEEPEHDHCDDGIPVVFLLPHYPEFFLRWNNQGIEFCSSARLTHWQLVPALLSFHLSKTDKQQSKNLFKTTAVILIFRLAC